MGWQDRPYYRDRGAGSGNPLMWLLSGSVSLGTWFGINVRVHASMIIFIVLTLLIPSSIGGWHNAVTSMALLFGIVLLHEFGHCLGSYLVGGQPSQILMHPLGGLAFADAPHRPWPNFFTVLCGPLVNVLICLLAAAFIAATFHSWRAVPWSPRAMAEAIYEYRGIPTSIYYAWWIFGISYALLLFNLWPVFPLDGGQMLQSLLWVKFGYYRATLFASITGMFGAGVMAILGLSGHNLFLILIAISGFLYCLQKYRELKANGPWAYEDESSYYTPSRGPSRGETRHRRRLQKLRRQAADEQEKIDAILAKVSAHGMQSLTFWEKRALHKATEHQRQRDAELSSRARERY